MFSRRIALAMLGSVLILTAGVMPVSAARPTRPAPAAERPNPPKERPLTAEEQAASDRKVADALRYLASPEAQAFGRVTLACATPDGRPPADATAAGHEAGGPGDPSTNAGCEVPHDFLSVSARDQTRGFYCGPAVGQVIANYTWAVPLDANKYTQAQIASWMKTDENLMTNAPAMVKGLDIATAGAPRRPANWAWVITRLEDTDRDGTFGDQLHDYVRANISGSRMPLAMSVKPHDPNGRYHLSSWERPVNSIGHWISAYGWRGLFDMSDTSLLYYTDSSKDEGGGTGRYWDPIRHIAGMIRDHTQMFVW
jgi:hypothetical protein